MKKRSNKPNCTAKTVTECMVKLTKYVEDLDGSVGGFDSWSVLATGETIRVIVTWPAVVERTRSSIGISRTLRQENSDEKEAPKLKPKPTKRVKE